MGYLTRDIPSSMKDLTYGWIVRAKNETVFSKNREIVEELPEEDSPHDRSEVVFKILTAGSGLFSDGYVNNSISTASTCKYSDLVFSVMLLIFRELLTNFSIRFEHTLSKGSWKLLSVVQCIIHCICWHHCRTVIIWLHQ